MIATRRLSLALFCTALVSLALAVMAGVVGSRLHLQAQQERTNQMLARALASQLSLAPKDVSTLNLLMSYFFEDNQLAEARYIDAQGRELVRLQRAKPALMQADWFAGVLPLAVNGSAPVLEKAEAVGRVETRGPLSDLNSSLVTIAGLQLAALLVGFVPMLIIAIASVRRVLRPLGKIIAQAEAVAQRRFITLDDPGIPELRGLVASMNAMSIRLRQWFESEAARIERMQSRANFDTVTQLANRDFFLQQFRDHVKSGTDVRGLLLVAQIENLGEVNTTLGYIDTNRMLLDLGHALQEFRRGAPEAVLGRLRGSEFALVLPGYHQDVGVPQRLLDEALDPIRDTWRSHLEIRFLAVSLPYDSYSHPAELLGQVDFMLARCKHAGLRFIEGSAEKEREQPVRSNEEWRRLIVGALERNHLLLEYFDVVDPKGGLLHKEAMVSIKSPSHLQPIRAGEFLPYAHRFDLLPAIDLAVVKWVIYCNEHPDFPLAVNLSAESLTHEGFIEDLRAVLQRSSINDWLSLEIPARAAELDRRALANLIRMVRSTGCRFGLEAVGLSSQSLSQIRGLEVDYVKLHPSLSSEILESENKREILEETCSLFNALGVRTIATSVETVTDMSVLKQLGVGGLTGRLVRVTA